MTSGLYQNGTVAVTNGTGVLAGDGTAWLANARIDNLVGIVSAGVIHLHRVTGVAGDGEMTVAPDYDGPTDAGLSYWILQTHLLVPSLLASVQKLLAGFQFFTATNTGSGTANAIEATTDSPVPVGDGSALIVLPIIETNTSTSVTVSFNGGDALQIKTASGKSPSVGALMAGGRVFGSIDNGGEVFRLFSELAEADLLNRANHLGTQPMSSISDAGVLAVGNSASDVPSTPVGGISATTVQGALAELDSEKAGATGPAGDWTVPGKVSSSGITWGTSQFVDPDTSWNDVTIGGVYRGQNVYNSPVGYDNWAYVLVQSHNATYVSQIAMGLNASSAPGLWWRRMTGGAWTSWYRLFDELFLATKAEAEAGGIHSKPMSPLRVKEAIDYQIRPQVEALEAGKADLSGADFTGRVRVVGDILDAIKAEYTGSGSFGAIISTYHNSPAVSGGDVIGTFQMASNNAAATTESAFADFGTVLSNATAGVEEGYLRLRVRSGGMSGPPKEVARFNPNTGLSMFGSNTVIDSNRMIRLRPYTVATLPTAGVAGREAVVTDADAPAWNAPVTGGGATHCGVRDNGSAWVAF